VIRFHSDSTAAQDLKEGFRIKYEQSPTDCAVLNSGTINPANVGLNNGQVPHVLAAMHQGSKDKIPIPAVSNVGPVTAIETKSNEVAAAAATAPASMANTKGRSNAKMFTF